MFNNDEYYSETRRCSETDYFIRILFRRKIHPSAVHHEQGENVFLSGTWRTSSYEGIEAEKPRKGATAR